MKYFFYALALFLSFCSQAQTKTVTGIVLEGGTQTPLANITVTELSTTNSTRTAANGQYRLTLNNPTGQLEFTGIGYTTLVVLADSAAQVFLQRSNLELAEVVITALGIERSKKELGYAVQSLKSKDLTQVLQPNLLNALSGRLAGVQITNGSSGVGSSARIVIRGENSLSGNNGALFVIDGVPISNNIITNNTENNETGFQEVDYGNGAAEISADDIEQITVLKGAGAAALYGSRAAGGVVVISTKKGTRKGISFNSSVTWEEPLRLPAYQNVYGAGAGGRFSYEDGLGAGVNDGSLTSFGPRMDGQLVKQFNSPSTIATGNTLRGADVIARNGNPITPTPFTAQPNNVKDFFRTGTTFINNISFAGGSEGASFRLSYTHLSNEGIMPNTNLKRHSLALSGGAQVAPKITATTFINYINSSSANRPAVGYGSENPMYTFNWTGRQVATADLRNYWQAGRTGFNQFNSNYLWLDNPYFSAYENTNGFGKDRLLGNAAINIHATPQLTLRVRTGLDHYNDLRTSKRAFSTKRFANGAYREDDVRYTELNTDVLATYTKDFNKQLGMTVSAGGNLLLQRSGYKSTTANQLSVPGIYNFGNAKVPLVTTQENSEKKVNSAYLLASLRYQDFLFADVTFRNDWSSALPQQKNAYAYYSASASWVLSQSLHLPHPISYARLRLSFAQVGNDTDPYQLNNSFVFNQNYGATPLLTSGTRFLNPALSPERLQGLEAGLELTFWNSRLGVDAAVYQNTTSQQIINLPASASSGYTTRLVNGGTVQNRGAEVVIRGVVVSNKNFTWQATANFSANRSRVTSLPQGIEQYITGFESLYASTDNTVYFIATPQNGGRVGDMWGTGLLTADGQTVYDSRGFPVRDGALRRLGNYNPDFMVGFNNDVSFKNIHLSFLWDWRQGGSLFSRTFSLGNTSGVLEGTLPGREGGITGAGVVNTGTAANPKYETNTKNINAADYYGQYYNRANEATSLFDASYVKLRQVSLGYALPAKWVTQLHAQGARLSVVGNNLLLFTKVPHVDPEVNAVQGRRYVYGVDDMSLPSSRSMGLNLNVQF